jgi:hypothetical protein
MRRQAKHAHRTKNTGNGNGGPKKHCWHASIINEATAPLRKQRRLKEEAKKLTEIETPNMAHAIELLKSARDKLDAQENARTTHRGQMRGNEPPKLPALVHAGRKGH